VAVLLALPLLANLLQVRPVAAATPCAAAVPEGLQLQAVAPGIYAAIRREPPGLLEHANSLVIVDDDGVVVVDAQMTVAATRELVRAIRALTRQPVRYVVNTHWHDDHVHGNEAYALAWPGVRFVSSAATRTDLAARGAANRREFVAKLPDEMAMLRHQLQAGRALEPRTLDPNGPPMDGAARSAYCSDLRQGEAYMGSQAATHVRLADLAVDGELVLHLGSREVQIVNVGHAHTAGDLVVWLPGERILAAGDVVSGYAPMAAPDADLAAWIAALDRLRALEPRVVLPGHGPVLEGTAQLLRTQELLRQVRQRAGAAYRAGMTPGQLIAAVDGTDLALDWAGDDTVRQLLFWSFFFQPAVAAEAHRLGAVAPT
jgi:glyoxylase-like metal-dependent hydrolase (beta-lactamase superfamily II)